jgi:ferredoxin
MVRQVVHIDEALCNGCGECIDACAEGAIALVGGKARLVSDVYCDGLGACLGECPTGAITVVEREADGFDEAAVADHLSRLGRSASPSREPAARPEPAPVPHPQPDRGTHGCPGSAARELSRRPLNVLGEAPGPAIPAMPQRHGSTLSHWPVQLRLVPASAPWLAGADLLVAADCVPFAYASFHADFLAGRKLVIGCPKLDDQRANTEKLTSLCARGDLKSITVVRMEVPCCGGISASAHQAVDRAQARIPVRDVVIGLDGAVREG